MEQEIQDQKKNFLQRKLFSYRWFNIIFIEILLCFWNIKNFVYKLRISWNLFFLMQIQQLIQVFPKSFHILFIFQWFLFVHFRVPQPRHSLPPIKLFIRKYTSIFSSCNFLIFSCFSCISSIFSKVSLIF